MLREEKKARARTAMADAAAALFAAHGYDNVAMTQVARAAGVSEQTLYNYFPTKESLVFDLADTFESTMLATLAARVQETERTLYPRCIRGFLDGTLRVEGARVVRAP